MKIELPFNFTRKSKTEGVIVDVRNFKEGEIKEVHVWCWRCRKIAVIMVSCKDGKFSVLSIACPHTKTYSNPGEQKEI